MCGRNLAQSLQNYLLAYLLNFSDLCQRNQETTAGFQGSEAKRPPRIQQLGSNLKNLKKMKQIFNIMANETQVEEVTTTKMDAKFVSDLQGIFRKIPKRTQMRFKQLPTGQLMIKIHAEIY